MKKSVYLAVLAVLGISSLALPAQKPAGLFSANTVAERIQNIESVRSQLKEYAACTCACGCYAHDLDVQANRAITFLHQRTARNRTGEKLALILDIDETSLNNYEQNLRMNFGYEKQSNNEWIDFAKAPVIPGTLSLYNEALRLGVSVFFITGRPESQRKSTEKNLLAAGYKNWQQIIFRSGAQAKATASDYKSSERAKIVAQGYKIILNVGDQWSDLRGKPEAEYSVKYPNPFYLIP